MRVRPAESAGRAGSDGRDPLDARVALFVGGLTAGALVGAAIAGSSLWRRRSRPGDGRSDRQIDPTPATPRTNEPAA